MAHVSVVEALLTQVAAGDVDAIPVLEDAIREGVEGAPRGVSYVLVEQPARRRLGVDYPAERVPGAFAVVAPKESVRLVGVRYPDRKRSPLEKREGYDRTFRVGDVAEYDNFNYYYTGRIVAVDRRGSVTVQKEHSKRRARLSLAEFDWRNYDLDLAAIEARNADVSMSI